MAGRFHPILLYLVFQLQLGLMFEVRLSPPFSLRYGLYEEKLIVDEVANSTAKALVYLLVTLQTFFH